eukprot:scaffold83535_cov21-Prasinocladus_malaysianus.AAC.1
MSGVSTCNVPHYRPLIRSFGVTNACVHAQSGQQAEESGNALVAIQKHLRVRYEQGDGTSTRTRLVAGSVWHS